MFAGVRIALGNLGSNRDKTFVFETANGDCGCAGKFYKFLERHFAAFFNDVPDFFLALGKLRKLAAERDRANVESLAPAGLFVSDGVGQDGFEGGFWSAAVVFADPAGELEDFGCNERLCADDFEDGLEFGAVGGFGKGSDATENFARSERNLNAAANADLGSEIGRNGVIELFAESEFESDACDHVGSSIQYSVFSFQCRKGRTSE